MKRFVFALVALIILQSCGVTYYGYYEVDSPVMAMEVSMLDGTWSPRKVSTTRCVAVYPDSTGRMVYLMETRMKDKVKLIEDRD